MVRKNAYDIRPVTVAENNSIEQNPECGGNHVGEEDVEQMGRLKFRRVKSTHYWYYDRDRGISQ